MKKNHQVIVIDLLSVAGAVGVFQQFRPWIESDTYAFSISVAIALMFAVVLYACLSVNVKLYQSFNSDPRVLLALWGILLAIAFLTNTSSNPFPVFGNAICVFSPPPELPIRSLIVVTSMGFHLAVMTILFHIIVLVHNFVIAGRIK